MRGGARGGYAITLYITPRESQTWFSPYMVPSVPIWPYPPSVFAALSTRRLYRPGGGWLSISAKVHQCVCVCVCDGFCEKGDAAPLQKGYLIHLRQVLVFVMCFGGGESH